MRGLSRLGGTGVRLGVRVHRRRIRNVDLVVEVLMMVDSRRSLTAVAHCIRHRADGRRMRAEVVGTWMPRAMIRSPDEP